MAGKNKIHIIKSYIGLDIFLEKIIGDGTKEWTLIGKLIDLKDGYVPTALTYKDTPVCFSQFYFHNSKHKVLIEGSADSLPIGEMAPVTIKDRLIIHIDKVQYPLDIGKFLQSSRSIDNKYKNLEYRATA